MLLECSVQLILAIWVGALAAVASLAVPSILDGGIDPVLEVRISLDLMGKLATLGCGAGGFLLLLTLLMYQLSMRTARGTLFQVLLLLSMTGMATALQVWLAPALSGMLRMTPDLLTAGATGAGAAHFRVLLGAYLALLLVQALIGAGLLLTGIRRWYRYVPASAAKTDFFWP